MHPNLAQVPAQAEYRSLFGPGKDRVQVGCDASGLELRCLGHYLSPFDGGKFAKEVVEGDIHTLLAEIYQTDRSTGKGVTYSMIYGAGDIKIGLVAGARKSKASALGKKIRGNMLANLDGFAELNKAVMARADTGVLKGLDGRPIRIGNKKHAALNYLLQSCGAIICKRWVVHTHRLLREAGICYWPLGFIHDEQQLSVAPEQAEQAAFLMTAAMKDVEQSVNFRCSLDSESKIGTNWSEVH